MIKRSGRTTGLFVLGVAVAALLWGVVAAAPFRSQVSDRSTLVEVLDSAVRAQVDGELVPGISVAVVRGADTLLMRGYGLADLEWDVATPEDGTASYEIGSMTKQFTAAAILQLVEAGEIDLSADVTEYLPDFDTQGRRVPVRRLLDHTSGIKGYTEMEAFGRLSMLDAPVDSLLHLMETEPFDFEPGTALIYNNSAFFLLGLIVEAVSGRTYEEYVEENLFAALGMEGSYYCSENEIHEARAHGYEVDGGTLVRKGYLNHKWPYAAGSLCSTVGDLVRWNQALHGGEVLSATSYGAMTTPLPLEDGTPTRYAMGLGVYDEGGRRIVTHGGGINGFLSEGRWYPDSELLVIVLQNAVAPPGATALGEQLANIVLGEPDRVGEPYDGDVSELVGTYRGAARGQPMTIHVTAEDGVLKARPEGSDNAMELTHARGMTWFGLGDLLLTFAREGNAVAELRFDGVGGLYRLRRVEG